SAAGNKRELRVESVGSDRFHWIVCSRKRKWMHISAPCNHVRDSINDVGVARAATEISAHALTNFRARQIGESEWATHVRCNGARPASFGFLDHGDARHDLARGTEATLETIMLDE